MNKIRVVLCWVVRIILYLSILLPFGHPLFGRVPGGNRLVSYYSPQDYNSQPQNWDIEQDNRGIIFVANQEGLLTYDGVSWRAFDVTNHSTRSLAYGPDGYLYIGGENEIGYMIPDPQGDLQYISLVHYLQENKRNFSTVWSTQATPDGILFRTSRLLIFWSQRAKKISYWQTDSMFLASFTACGNVYVQVRDAGLFQLIDGSLKRLPGTDILAREKITLLIPYKTNPTTNDEPDGSLLIGLRPGALYIYDGENTRPFPTEADPYLEKHELYDGIGLSSFPGHLALGTRWGGLILIDDQGHLEQIIDKKAGLPDPNIRSVFEDRQGNLWLGLTRGIAKIENSVPLAIYKESSGIPGIILSIVRSPLDHTLYVGTYTGLYRLEITGEFQEVKGIPGQYWSLLPVETGLLVATDQGVAEIKHSSTYSVDKTATYVLLRSTQFPGTVFTGTAFGLSALGTRENQWQVMRHFDTVTGPVNSIVETGNRQLWLGTPTQGVIQVDFPDRDLQSIVTVTPYGQSHGLPPGEVFVVHAAGHVMSCTATGIFCFDPATQRFVPDTTLGSTFAGGSRGVFRLVEDKNQHIWFHSEFHNYHAIPTLERQGYKIEPRPFLRMPPGQVNVIYPDPEEPVTWFGTHEQLMRFDRDKKKNYNLPFATVIRRVTINDKDDLYIGFGLLSRPGSSQPVLTYRDRDVRFEFGAPFFEGEAGTRYQCILEGYDPQWSQWSAETHRVYTNLDGGTYQFRVRSKNVYGHTGSECIFPFEVLPPWYKRWWVLPGYFVTAFFTIYLLVLWRSRKLQHEKEKLELLVEERTREIIGKNKLLEEQAIRLKKKSQKLKEMAAAKSCFLANISHEFRTPLSLIMGPLQQMLANTHNTEQKGQLNMMSRNTLYLLNLINQLLDLARFESGQMKLKAARQDIKVFIKGILEAFEISALQKDLTLAFSADTDLVWVYFDHEKLGQVIGNLFFNIVKFTHPGGSVEISIKTPYSSGFVDITVLVSGISIPADQLPYIFDRFYRMYAYEYQAENTSNIGMALAKELVNLHRGELRVQQKEDGQTCFLIRLPLGCDHLKPEEIVETDSIKQKPPRLAQLAAGSINDIPDQHHEPGEEENENDESNQGKMIILVVDDSSDAREYMRRSLEPAYKVLEAANGSEGLAKAKKTIPDLVITDVIMPEKNGFTLCKELKMDRYTSHIPVILLTARASEENILQGLESGADDYITKPFNSKLFKARVKNLIELRRQFHLKLDREMTLQPVQISISPFDQEFIDDLKNIIENNLADSDFNVEELGKKLYMSRATLYRKIHALSGQSPNEFIRAYRLKRAAQLLNDKSKNVTDIAFSVGFSSTAYFTKCFKEKFHQLPSLFQLSARTSKTDSIN